MGALPPRRPPRASEPGGAGGRAPEGEPYATTGCVRVVSTALCAWARAWAPAAGGRDRRSGKQGAHAPRASRTRPRAGWHVRAAPVLGRAATARATYVPVWCGVGGRGARTHRRVAPAGRRNRQRRRLARSACLCELPRLLLPEPELRPGVHTPCNASACELDLTYASGKVADSALCSRVHPRRSMAVVLRRQAEPPS